MARQSTGQAEQSHSRRRSTHARKDATTFSHVQTLQRFPHLSAGVSAQEVPRQLSKPSTKERTTEPNHQPKQALCAIVHQRRASTQIKQQSSICLHYIQQFASSLICTLAMQENKVLRLIFFPHAKDAPNHQNPNIQRLCLQETD